MEPIYFSVWETLFLFGFPIVTMFLLSVIKDFFLKMIFKQKS